MSWLHPLDRCSRRRHRPEMPRWHRVASSPRIAAVIGILWVFGTAAVGATSPLPGAPAPAPGWGTMSIWGGDVRSMAVAPDDPDLVLAGTSTGQLYISRNGGASWSDAGAPFSFAGWVVSSLRWDPNRAGRLWVALWGSGGAARWPSRTISARAGRHARRDAPTSPSTRWRWRRDGRDGCSPALSPASMAARTTAPAGGS